MKARNLIPARLEIKLGPLAISASGIAPAFLAALVVITFIGWMAVQ